MPSGNASVLDKENGADRLETKIMGGLKGGLANGNYLHGCRRCSALRPFTACFRYSGLFSIKLEGAEVSDFLCIVRNKKTLQTTNLIKEDQVSGELGVKVCIPVDSSLSKSSHMTPTHMTKCRDNQDISN